MSHYLAITIGPIYATLQQARKTRELWAASYLFSRLMELLAGQVKDELKGEILLPRKVEAAGRVRYGAGIYNDRLFARVDACDAAAIEKAIGKASEQLAGEAAPDDKQADPGFWRSYFRIEWACKPIESLQNGDLFKQMEPLLDTAELHSPYSKDLPDDNTLTKFLDDVYKTALARNALQGDNLGRYKAMIAGRGLFPSTADFGIFELYNHPKTANACKTLLAETEKSEDGKKIDSQDAKQIEMFYNKLFGDEEPVKNGPLKAHRREYHKYFCIVHADGDNLSRLNATLNSEKDYQKLSEKLSGYALDAAGIIDAYGGKPVYIGGDDLVFFAPVCSYKDGHTVSVFQLIQALSREYEKLGLGDATHLSFGITLSYYKFPLFEARQLSYEQLTDQAKKAKWRGGGEKNAVAFRLLKHSGAYFEGILSKTVLDAFVQAEQHLRDANGDLLSGVVYKMETLGGLIRRLQLDGQLEDRLEPLFDNFFNERVHKNNEKQMRLVRELLRAVSRAGNPAGSDAGEDRDGNLYALLRLLKFVTDAGESSRGKTIQTNTTTTQTL